MFIRDRVYPSAQITGEVLIELIASKPVQRLKKINQSGIKKYLLPPHQGITRYEHSIGVMLLLKMFGATINEQIAGLLHDVPHTAFSHVIDYVYPNENFNFHEKFKEKMLINSEIPQILANHGIKMNDILSTDKYTLLERPIPDLCADRIDYFLRELALREGKSKSIKCYLEHLKVFNKEFVFDDIEVAEDFAKCFIKINIESWADIHDAALYHILADAIKTALNEQVIDEEDLFTDDEKLLKKLKWSLNPKVLDKLKLISPKLKIKVDSKDYDFFTKNKVRYVNPKVMVNKSTKRLSELNSRFKESIKAHNESISRGAHIKIMEY